MENKLYFLIIQANEEPDIPLTFTRRRLILSSTRTSGRSRACCSPAPISLKQLERFPTQRRFIPSQRHLKNKRRQKRFQSCSCLNIKHVEFALLLFFFIINISNGTSKTNVGQKDLGHVDV